MLGWPDIEVLAFAWEDDLYCRACAVKKWSTVRIEKVERGLDDTPERVIRYELHDDAIERGWPEAEERIEQFRLEHPAICALIGLPEADVVLTYGQPWHERG